MIATVASCVPTLLLLGQLSAWNCASVQRAAAVGSPTSPCGSTTSIDFTSSLDETENAKSPVTSGCAPACVVDGVIFRFVICADATAEAGSAAASRQSSRQARGRR